MVRSIVLLVGLTLLSSACSHGRFKESEDWNKKERGALIGGASGAALGGLVGSQSNSTGAGAVIGGAAGAGAGALIGNEIDKQDEKDD